MARQRNQVTIRPSQRRQQSRLQREKSKQRAIIVAGIIAIMFIVAIPAYGYWSNFIAPPKTVVLKVDDTEFTLGFMSRYMNGIQALAGSVDMLVEPFRVIQQLQENEIIRRGALGNGITVESSAIDEEVRNRIIGSSSDLADVSADQLEREFNESYIQYLNTADLSEEEHRGFVEVALLRDKIKEIEGADVPSTAKQANLSWIVIATGQTDGQEEVANANETVVLVSEGLEVGEDFAILAEQFSDDRNTAVKGGEYGWIPEGAFGMMDDIIFSLTPEEVSDPIFTDDYIYFLKVTEIDDSREVDEQMMSRLKERAFQEWLAEERGNHRITSCFGGGSSGGPCDWQYDWLVKQVSKERRELVTQ